MCLCGFEGYKRLRDKRGELQSKDTLHSIDKYQGFKKLSP